MDIGFFGVLFLYNGLFCILLGIFLGIMTPFLLIRFILNIDHPKKKFYQIASALLGYPLFLFIWSSHDTWSWITTSTLISSSGLDIIDLCATYSLFTLFLGVALLAIRKILIPNKTKDLEHLE